MELWNSLSDPTATLSALEAASTSNPVVQSLAQAGHATSARQSSCPPDQAAFFANLSIYQDMARRLDTDPDFIMALSAHESGWLGSHAKEIHNLFGVTQGGGPNLRYESYQAAADYWVAHYAQYVQGARTMDEFVSGLRRLPYNTRDPDYDAKLRNAYSTLQRYRQACGIE
jgi:flagellum-specific peptidoglycan hydrolase FlgJ